MKEYSPIKVVINDGDSRDTSEESLITIKQKQCLDLGEKNRVLYKNHMYVHVVPQKMFITEMGEVRIFLNTPSCPMDKIGMDTFWIQQKLIWGVLEPKNCAQ